MKKERKKEMYVEETSQIIWAVEPFWGYGARVG
jgi:hypothetical protein